MKALQNFTLIMKLKLKELNNLFMVNHHSKTQIKVINKLMNKKTLNQVLVNGNLIVYLNQWLHYN